MTVYAYSGILFTHDKEWCSDTGYSEGGPWQHYTKRKKPDAKRAHTLFQSSQGPEC